MKELLLSMSKTERINHLSAKSLIQPHLTCENPNQTCSIFNYIILLYIGMTFEWPKAKTNPQLLTGGKLASNSLLVCTVFLYNHK